MAKLNSIEGAQPFVVPALAGHEVVVLPSGEIIESMSPRYTKDFHILVTHKLMYRLVMPIDIEAVSTRVQMVREQKRLIDRRCNKLTQNRHSQ